MKKPTVVRVAQRTVKMQRKGKMQTLHRWYVHLAFGDTVKKLAISKTIADWLKGAA